ncbi:MFS general substrate transporter [Cubamyces lactineus]|nr:MFS general substrate transporter [Cubamyces lactineus]
MSSTEATVNSRHAPTMGVPDVEQAPVEAPVLPIDAGSTSDPYRVKLETQDDPKSLPSWRKWLAVLIISSSSLCATFASSVSAFTEDGLVHDLHTSHEASYTLFFAFTWPTAFPPHIAVFLVFRFLSGLCSAAFLSVAGGSISDLFDNAYVATPMAVYTASPFVGPILGPIVGGFVVQNTDWRWCYYTLLIWQFVLVVLLFTCVPETYVPVILRRKAIKLRKTTGDQGYYAPIEHQECSLFHMIMFNICTLFKLLIFDRMALALDCWTALLLAILYLAFEAFPIIFQEVRGFNAQSTGLTFLGFGCGMLSALAAQPYWNGVFRRQAIKYNGHPPPEVRLIIAQVGGILAPIGLFIVAFTTYKQVHWIAGSAPFGAVMYYIFSGVFTYLVTAYRPIAASAMAANSAMRGSWAAAFPLFAGAMYHRLGTVGATALLAGLTAVMAPLPFIFYEYGAELRAKSRFAAR